MTLDIILTVLGGICIIIGIAGCVLPVLPGPVLTYAGLVLLQLSSLHPFSMQFLVIYALLMGMVALLDYVIPIYGTKKFQGSKYGIWGSTAGLIVGILFFFPLGIILGPALGAFAGEIISGKSKDRAFKSAMGSFLGFLAGTAIKLILSLSMAYHYVVTVYKMYNIE